MVSCLTLSKHTFLPNRKRLLAWIKLGAQILLLPVAGAIVLAALPILVLYWLVTDRVIEPPDIKHQVRLERPFLYRMWRGFRLGVGAAAAVSYGTFLVSGLLASIGLGCVMFIGNSVIPLWLMAACFGTASVSIFVGERLRLTAKSIDIVRPLNNASADEMPLSETLLRGANCSEITQHGQ